MRLLLLSLLLAGCATTLPTYIPENNEEYLDQIEAHFDQEIKAETSRTYAYTGVALVVAGVALGAFAGRYKSALVTGIAGVVLMTFPFIFNAVWFDWVIGAVISVGLIYGLWIIFRLTTAYINNKTGHTTESDSDKQG